MIGLVLLFTFTFGGYFMYSLLRNSFGLSCAPSVISGLFYITTPVIFNKVAAGHVPYIVAYALSPLVMACFVKYAHESKTKYLLITGLLVAFATIQIQFAIMLTLLLFFYALLVAKMKVRVLVKTFLFIVILVSLVHSFWLLPGSSNLSSFSATIRGASSVSDLRTWGTSLTNAFRMIGYRSPHFETALANYDYKNVWDIASFLLVIFSFGSLLTSKKGIPLFFSVVSVVTLIFTTISGPFEIVVYSLYSLFPIFNVFREVYHLAFLIGFSYSIMLAFFLQTICNSKRLMKYLKILMIIAVLGAVVLNDPFIYSGDFSGQLQKYQLNSQDLSVMNGYLQSDGDYRVLYLPMVQPFKYDDLRYYGVDPTIAYSQKPTMGNYFGSDFLIRVALDFYLPSSNLTNVLDLMSVKYIFFRNDFQSMLPLYLSEGKLPIGDGYYDIRPIWTNDNLFKTLVNQQSLKLSNSTKNLSVFENKDFLPHIYPATIPIAVNGSTDELFTLLLSSTIDNLDNKAIFLSEQLNQEQWQFIKNYTKTSIAVETPSVITFKKVNPTKYEVKVENATQPFFIIFNENYNPQWKAYLEDKGADFSRVIASYPNINVKEADHEERFAPEDTSYLFNKPIDEKNHFIADGYANAWYIDPQQVSNGNENFTITLYYLPQSYYYLGLLTSGITISVCIGYLIYLTLHHQIKKAKCCRIGGYRTKT